MSDVEKTSQNQAGKTEGHGPEPNATPGENNSGSESRPSVSGPRKRYRQGIEGAKRLLCRRCGHFLAELKADEFQVLLLCHRCKQENSFAFEKLS